MGQSIGGFKIIYMKMLFHSSNQGGGGEKKRETYENW